MIRNRKKRFVKRLVMTLLLSITCLGYFKIYTYYSESAQALSTKSYYDTERTIEDLEKRTLIVVDAGHGDFDPGSDNEGYLEKDINLEIALKLQAALEEAGYAVLMTRSDDTFLELYERSDFANEANADLFISIHQNDYAQDSSVNGIEVYYNSSKTTEDKKFAQMVQDALIHETGANNRGIRVDNGLVVTRETTMPAILVETAFISSEKELPLITSDDYQNKVVAGMIAGIKNFLG